MLLGKLPIISLISDGRLSFHKYHKVYDRMRGLVTIKIPELTNYIEDYETKKAAAEIFAGCRERYNVFEVDFTFQDTEAPSAKICNLELSCGRNSNILKRLWDRYGSKIKISVHVLQNETKLDTWNRNHPVGAEKMSIDPESYTCKCSTLVSYSWFPSFVSGDEASQKSKLRISFHIPDSSDQVPQRENIPHKIFDEGLCSDVTITAENGAQIKAHKCFLAASSPVFRKMFETQMQESITGQVDVPDISEKGLRAFLKYIYNKDLSDEEEDLEVLYELLYAADKYRMPTLETLMNEKLLVAQDLSFEIKLGFKLYKFVNASGRFASLKEKSLQILKLNLNELESLPEYIELFQENIEGAMKLCKDFALHKCTCCSALPNLS